MSEDKNKSCENCEYLQVCKYRKPIHDSFSSILEKKAIEPDPKDYILTFNNTNPFEDIRHTDVTGWSFGSNINAVDRIIGKHCVHYRLNLTDGMLKDGMK